MMGYNHGYNKLFAQVGGIGAEVGGRRAVKVAVIAAGEWELEEVHETEV